MSADPSAMQQMLVAQLTNKAGQPGTAGGGAAGPQMQGQTSGANLIAQLAQKAMLMKALQSSQANQAATAQANSMMPATNAQMANDPTMNAMMNGPGLDPATQAALNAQLAQQPMIPGAAAGAPALMPGDGG